MSLTQWTILIGTILIGIGAVLVIVMAIWGEE